MNERQILIHKYSESEDSDKKYGLPELKKYPMPDADHVRSAIKFFNYVEPHNEEKLAKAILKRMKEYGLTFDDFSVGEDNRFSKYIPDKALSHHGIEGQKWGVENGPPYPLDYYDHSSAELRNNPKSELDNYGMGKSTASKVKDFAKKHKKALIIGGIALTAVAIHKGDKYVNAKKKENIGYIQGYWKDKLPDGDVQNGKKFMKKMENDLYRMKLSDLRKEAKSIGKNNWSTLSYDSNRWTVQR